MRKQFQQELFIEEKINELSHNDKYCVINNTNKLKMDVLNINIAKVQENIAKVQS
jgi:hypothetical protein